MRKFLLVILISFTTNVFCQDWKTNFEESKTVATSENKNIILVFSGSDWCAPCIKLEKNIWSSAEFQEESQKDWVLLKADFPKKKANQLAETLQIQNDQLAENYNKEGYFPLVVVLDKNGNVLGKVGYENLKPTAYIELLHSLEKK